MNIYEQCPVLENERFKARLVSADDCADLLKVYSTRLEKHGFSLSYEKLVGTHDEYDNYYVLKKQEIKTNG